MSIVLASASPRRRELLEMLGVSDLIISPATGEEKPPSGASPGVTVECLSAAKALEASDSQSTDDVIIAADTIVWLNGRMLGKPHSREEACDMLRELSGREHHVYTGVTVIKGEDRLTEHEITAVRFRLLSDGEINAYVDTGEPMDKAGAYGAQGKGALFVEHIDGDFFNVMGLPLCRLGNMLKRMGVVIL